MKSVQFFDYSAPSKNQLRVVNHDAIKIIYIPNRIICLKLSFHEMRGQDMVCLICRE